MSRTYNIACTQCKKCLWIGQAGHGEAHIYTAQPEGQLLGKFLFDHVGHPLIFDRSEKFDDEDEWDDLTDYGEDVPDDTAISPP